MCFLYPDIGISICLLFTSCVHIGSVVHFYFYFNPSPWHPGCQTDLRGALGCGLRPQRVSLGRVFKKMLRVPFDAGASSRNRGGLRGDAARSLKTPTEADAIDAIDAIGATPPGPKRILRGPQPF